MPQKFLSFTNSVVDASDLLKTFMLHNVDPSDMMQLIMIYYFMFISVVNFGLIFWASSCNRCLLQVDATMNV
jgi:hypothetical protein